MFKDGRQIHMDGLRNLWGGFKTPLTTDCLQTNRNFVRSMEKMCSHDAEVLKTI